MRVGGVVVVRVRIVSPKGHIICIFDVQSGIQDLDISLVFDIFNSF